jgi:L-fuculose-phosphate aldolase
MKLEVVGIIDLRAQRVEGNLKRSSESPMHTIIFRERPDVHAIIHSHSTHATAFAVAGKSISIVCTEGLAVNGPLPAAEYACPGTEEQGRAALRSLQGPPPVNGTLRHHSVLTIGPNLERAYNIAYRIELSTQIYFLASQIGMPTALMDEQVSEIRKVYLKK